MATETEAYKINLSPFATSEECVCKHSFAAHGSNGKICCACPCFQFVQNRKAGEVLECPTAVVG